MPLRSSQAFTIHSALAHGLWMACRVGKPYDEVIDVIEMVDGAWQKRGCTSLFGVLVLG